MSADSRPRPARAPSVEVESLEQFDALVAGGARSMRGWRLQDLDLTGRGPALRRLDPAGALVLGGRMATADEESLRHRGALLFPSLPDLPFDAYRSTLYSPEDLYAGLEDGYDASYDGRVYAWSLTTGDPRGDTRGDTRSDVVAALARALHDHAVDDALEEYVASRRLVGVMGGHAADRGTAGYAEAARLGRLLAAGGLEVMTGGGPGTMEAANLGAFAAGLDEPDLQHLLDRLARVPSYHPSVTAWAEAALEVRAAVPAPGNGSLGVPTWFYGHEPPNVFASRIAKYFRNALREDTLLRLADAGVVFLPGAAGTVQEVFQDACENYYAAPGARAPMVLVGRRHWTETLPAWPLLVALAAQRDLEHLVHLVDSVEEAAAVVLEDPPRRA